MNKKIKKVGIKGVTASLIMATAITVLSAPVTTYAYNPGGDGNGKILSWDTETFTNNKMLWWQTRESYDPKKVSNRIVSGDFNGDGISEIVGFYEYGNNLTELHQYSEKGSSTMWSSGVGNFNAQNITGKIAVGDFDGNGKDEIVTLYDYRNSTVALFKFSLNDNGTAFNCETVWKSNAFNGSNVPAMVAGDFNGNKKDELLVFYDYGNRKIGMFELSQNANGSFSDRYAWEGTSFDSSQIRGKTVAGNFNGDSKDEVVMFYDNGNNTTRVSTLFNSDKEGKYYLQESLYMESFDASRINNKVAVTKDKDGVKDKIIAFYDYSYLYNTVGIFSFQMNSKNEFSDVKVKELKNFEGARIEGRVVAGNFDGTTSRVAAMQDGLIVNPSVTKTPVEKATEWMINLANDNSHGYDQTNRWGPNYDCSSAVITAWEQAGVKVKSLGGATYTGNMRSAFISQGFTDVTTSVNISTGAGLQYGDVLLNTSEHTAMYIGNGQIVHASMNEFGGITGGASGDQTGNEICTRSYYNHPWNVVLRYK